MRSSAEREDKRERRSESHPIDSWDSRIFQAWRKIASYPGHKRPKSFKLEGKQLRNEVRTRDTINRRDRRRLIWLIHSVNLLPKAFGVGWSKSSRHFLMPYWTVHSVSGVSLHVYISRSEGLFNLMKNTRGRRSSLLPENMPKVSLLLVQMSSSILAWNRGRVTYTAGRVDTAQSWRHNNSCSQNQSSVGVWTVHWGSQQSQIELKGWEPEWSNPQMLS